MIEKDVHQWVREHCGRLAQVKGAAPARGYCGTKPEQALEIRDLPDETEVAPEDANLGLGSDNPFAIARLRSGESVLDLGCGGGFDCFLASRQVGPSGHVTGVDMTAEMVARARANAERLQVKNVQFLLAEIEHLPVPDSTMDVILSNSVINSSSDISAAFREVYRVLRPGGRLALTDRVVPSEMPPGMVELAATYAACIAGAVLFSDIDRAIRDAGFESVRVTVNANRRSFMREWRSELDRGKLLASAIVEAKKPLRSGRETAHLSVKTSRNYN